MKRFVTIVVFVLFSRLCFSQIILLNSIDSIFYINQGTLCSFATAGPYCNQSSGEIIFSTALHKDTLYFLIRNGSLYRMKLGLTSSCVRMTGFPVNGPFGTAVNSMTTDKNGLIYAADGATGYLYRYNPYSNQTQNLGKINARPGGDLVFYKDKLLLATTQMDIFEININDPFASTLYMSTPGHIFYGLISVPFDCERNKYYGLEPFMNGTQLYELDMENRTMLGLACEVPIFVYDAASNVDNGNNIGVTINNINISPGCGNDHLADINIAASTATPGPLTYTLDQATTNNSGVFNGVTEGVHSIKITNQINCFKDSLITVNHGLSPLVIISSVNPISCDQQNGSITVTATSGFLPTNYSIDGAVFQPGSTFNNLSGGEHHIKILDAAGCQKDTTVYLHYQVFPTFLKTFGIQPTICNSKTGSIGINLSSGINPVDVSASLNNGPFQTSLSFQNLDAGSYIVSALFQNKCRYDTLIIIERLTNEKPHITVQTTDQQCLINNGSAKIFISGSHNPYVVNFNNSGYSANTFYNNLAPGQYDIRIQDKNTCQLDTTIEILSYKLLPYTLSVQKTDPTCTDTKGGKIAVMVFGGQSPYYLKLNNTIYSNGISIDNLKKGNYAIVIFNNDNCAIDTVEVELTMELTPECDFIFVPNAFTPNDDGLNDKFGAAAGEGIVDFEFAVYNRWGQMLFFTNEKEKEWDGRFSGTKQAAGAYVWKIKYKTHNSASLKILKGTVILIR